jgi:hypothetical protein
MNDDQLVQKMMDKALLVERGFAHEQSLAKSKRQGKLFDTLDRFLNENIDESLNDT